MTALNLSYRHNHHHRPHFNSKTDIGRVAAEVRRQLGAESTVALTLKQLTSVERIVVNGVGYDLWSDVEHDVHDEAGDAVLGVFEFTPQASLEAVSISVSPSACDEKPELMLSTFGHEFGHAIYDGPALIHSHQNQPLFQLRHAGGSRAYRSVTDTTTHLQDAEPGLNSEQRRAEWRANEFMGSLLVPENLLWTVIREEAPKHAFAVRVQDTLFGDSHDGVPYLEPVDAIFDVSVQTLAAAVAPRFGVTPRFVLVRMKVYGILPQDTPIN